MTTNDYKDDPETYKGIIRKEHPEWGGWKEIDRHKKMYGFPDNLIFSNVLKILYNDWLKKTNVLR